MSYRSDHQENPAPPFAPREEMTEEEHRQRHQVLHRALDELLADFILHTSEPPLRRPILDLVEWSHQQTIQPSVKER